MILIILEQCEKELCKFPKRVAIDFTDIAMKLLDGIKLAESLVKPIFSVGKNVYELRLRDETGAYRVIYFKKRGSAIYMVHAFKKKTKKTPKKHIDLARKRIRRII